MTVGLFVVCEAPEDFAVATCIVDRTLRETETNWLRRFASRDAPSPSPC